MFKKKLLLLMFLGSAFVFLASTSYSPVPLSTPASQLVYRQNPPIVEHIRVRKIVPPPSGGNNIVMEIEYEDSTVIDDSVVIDQGAVGDIVFRDNGVAPDAVAHDFIYTAAFFENIALFRLTIANWQTALANKVATQGRYIRFEGHNGYEKSTAPTFDFAAFDLFEEVDVSTDLVGVGCVAFECNQIQREKSLFITDLSVVEDQYYTYNAKTGMGNPLGAWSFGRMIKSLSGTNNVNTFLKEWIKHWLVTQTINGQAVATRKQIVQQLIEPWIIKAYANNSQTIASGTITELNWEDYWTPSSGLAQIFMNAELELFKSAPFRLTAIVNRIDLRGNTGYSNSINNAGETRFIFTLINPNTHAELFPDFPIGDIPMHNDPSPATGAWPMIDWMGMNVIFEYGNVQTNKCDLRAFARQWIDLSNYTFTTLPNPAYNSALAAITNTVTYPNVSMESAINNVRTNEKLFFETDPTLAGFVRWDRATWEMRQFQLTNLNMIVEVPVTNTPRDETNSMNSLRIPASDDCLNIIPDPADWCVDGNYALALGGWVTASLGNQLAILNNRHNLPPSYGVYQLAAGSSIAKAEYAHSQNVSFVDGNDYDPARRKLRQRFSLNTCQGCHGGETKTIFTQVRPLSYGVPARYWLPNPDFTVGELDCQANIKNTGHTTAGEINYPMIMGNNKWDNVSAFLTGRKNSGTAAGPNIFADDNPSDAGDNTMEGLYYVNDPLNDYNNGYYVERWGYNDLLMRKQDLCAFYTSNCRNKGVIIDIANQVTQMPFAEFSH
jgi:hypothetical protein